MSVFEERRLAWNKTTGMYMSDDAVRVPFLRGPIPMPWLAAAANEGGACLAVGIALWFLAGLTSRRNDLRLSSERLRDFGVSRYAKTRALQRLESAGLIYVVRRRGRSPCVTLIDRKSL